VRQHLEARRIKVSDRALAAIFLDKSSTLAEILGPKIGGHIRDILDRCGNTKDGPKGLRKTISDKRLRQIFAELRTAMPAFRSRKCKPLQAQFICEAVPMLFRQLDGHKI